MHRLIFLILILLAVVGIFKFSNSDLLQSSPVVIIPTFTPAPSPTPTLIPIETYQPPQIQSSEAYTIILVGDSMIETLGPNFDYLRKYLKAYYPSKTFGIFNYGFGGTNILSVNERLHNTTQYAGN